MRVVPLGDELSRPQLETIATKLNSSKRILIVAGAGISCNAGIPDFRSKDGLYALVKKKYSNTVVKGQDLFDINVFRKQETTEMFYSFMAGLRTATFNASATPTHHFLKLLKDKKKLLRCYTQNIDGLEYRAGLTELNAVQLHGDLHTLKCTNCHGKFEWTDVYYEQMINGIAPDCMYCADASLARTVSGKRKTTVGQLKPDIVLYGEDHPKGDSIAEIASKDSKRSPQLLIVAGTSLKVLGIKRLVKDLAASVHANGGIAVFVNKTGISKSEWNKVFDFHVLGDSDSWILELKQQIPDLFRIQTKIKVERKRKPVKQEEQKIKQENGDTTQIKQEVGQDINDTEIKQEIKQEIDDIPNQQPKSDDTDVAKSSQPDKNTRETDAANETEQNHKYQDLPLMAKRSKSVIEKTEFHPEVVVAKRTKSSLDSAYDGPPNDDLKFGVRASKFSSVTSLQSTNYPLQLYPEISESYLKDPSCPLMEPSSDVLTDPVPEDYTDVDSDSESAYVSRDDLLHTNMRSFSSDLDVSALYASRICRHPSEYAPESTNLDRATLANAQKHN